MGLPGEYTSVERGKSSVLCSAPFGNLCNFKIAQISNMHYILRYCGRYSSYGMWCQYRGVLPRSTLNRVVNRLCFYVFKETVSLIIVFLPCPWAWGLGYTCNV